MKQTDPQLKFRITPELKERLQTAADAARRPLNSEIIDRLERSFGEDKSGGMSWIKRVKASALPNAAPEGVTDPVEERLDARIDELEKRLRDLEDRLPKPLS
ncbi:MAG: Arc family DNA-binding protein [Methylocystis sp.]|jgi:uncharacterized protein YceH (UPF0502 family)